jgi:hypothetical protein
MKKTLLVLALGLSAVINNAYAATYAATTSGDGFQFSASYSGTTTFHDYVSFSTFGLESIVSSISGSASNSFVFTQFNLLDSSYSLVTAGDIFSGGAKASFGALEGLGAGDYYLEIAGKSIGATAGYNGTITLSAVPEPETNSLLLAGIGMLGFIARRKFTK